MLPKVETTHDGTPRQYATSAASQAIGRQSAAAHDLTGMVKVVMTAASNIGTLSRTEGPTDRQSTVRHLDTTGTATKAIGTSAGRPTIGTTAENSHRIGRGTGTLRSLANHGPWPMRTVGLSNDPRRFSRERCRPPWPPLRPKTPSAQTRGLCVGGNRPRAERRWAGGGAVTQKAEIGGGG